MAVCGGVGGLLCEVAKGADGKQGKASWSPHANLACPS